jgi:menaquinone-9 beta-reductase
MKITQAYDCDALIVGAGPAGAAAAFQLARAGHRVWLLDAQRFPRDKVCGDFVGPVALAELEPMGLSGLDAFQATNAIDRASLFLNGRRLICDSIPQVSGLPGHGRVIPRMSLDLWTAQAARDAGALLLEGHRVTGLERVPGAVVAVAEGAGETRRIRTRLLIGADGSHSLTARWLRGYRVPDTDRIVAVRAYFDGVAGPDDEADLYFTGASFPGYYWLFPTGPGQANVGIGMVTETVPPDRADLKALLTELIATDAALNRRLSGARLIGKVRGWPLTTYDHRLPIHGERLLLVGDAAGLINPLNGEGIQYALLSGRWAAELADRQLATDDLSHRALADYRVRVEEALRYDMALSGIIVQLIRNRDLNPVWLRALAIITRRAERDPEYAAITGGVLAGLVPASRALGAKVILGTIQEAALSLGLEPLLYAASHPLGAALGVWGLGRAGAQIVYNTARHPRSAAGWGLGAASSAWELAGQVVRGIARR